MGPPEETMLHVGGAVPAVPSTLDLSQELTAPWQACGWLTALSPPVAPGQRLQTVPTLYHEVFRAFLSCTVSP